MADRSCARCRRPVDGAGAARRAPRRRQAQVWASSTITSSGQVRRNSSRRRSALMKSVETTTIRVALEERLSQACNCAPAGRPCLAAPARRRCGTCPAVRLPLLGELRRAEHGQRARLRRGRAVRGRSAGFDGLADAHVIGDQQAHRIELERHQQRHELVRARLDGDTGKRAERPGAGAEAEAHRIAQQAAGAIVAGHSRGRADQRWPAPPFQAADRCRSPRLRCRPAGAPSAGRSSDSGRPPIRGRAL